MMHLKVVLDASGSLALSTSAGQTQSHKHLTDSLRQPPFKNPMVTGGSLLSVGGIALTVHHLKTLGSSDMFLNSEFLHF